MMNSLIDWFEARFEKNERKNLNEKITTVSKQKRHEIDLCEKNVNRECPTQKDAFNLVNDYLQQERKKLLAQLKQEFNKLMASSNSFANNKNSQTIRQAYLAKYKKFVATRLSNEKLKLEQTKTSTALMKCTNEFTLLQKFKYYHLLQSVPREVHMLIKHAAANLNICLDSIMPISHTTLFYRYYQINNMVNCTEFYGLYEIQSCSNQQQEINNNNKKMKKINYETKQWLDFTCPNKIFLKYDNSCTLFHPYVYQLEKVSREKIVNRIKVFNYSNFELIGNYKYRNEYFDGLLFANANEIIVLERRHSGLEYDTYYKFKINKNKNNLFNDWKEVTDSLCMMTKSCCANCFSPHHRLIYFNKNYTVCYLYANSDVEKNKLLINERLKSKEFARIPFDLAQQTGVFLASDLKLYFFTYKSEIGQSNRVSIQYTRGCFDFSDESKCHILFKWKHRLADIDRSCLQYINGERSDFYSLTLNAQPVHFRICNGFIYNHYETERNSKNYYINFI